MDAHALDPQLFAHYMWPTSPSWRASSPGRGAYLKARSFLARLRADGLVASDRDRPGLSYRVTPEGERLAFRGDRLDVYVAASAEAHSGH